MAIHPTTTSRRKVYQTRRVTQAHRNAKARVATTRAGNNTARDIVHVNCTSPTSSLTKIFTIPARIMKFCPVFATALRNTPHGQPTKMPLLIEPAVFATVICWLQTHQLRVPPEVTRTPSPTFTATLQLTARQWNLPQLHEQVAAKQRQRASRLAMAAPAQKVHQVYWRELDAHAQRIRRLQGGLQITRMWKSLAVGSARREAFVRFCVDRFAVGGRKLPPNIPRELRVLIINDLNRIAAEAENVQDWIIT
ncbi:hypothetical protein ONS95_001426 [Cadophora gregata]|uniref:uncharacterized protein n=1 Tax=Cadophora gregata TaxID=51156 RepID=UPI0026DB4F87|nr:uncharacterized protein ONS95_001426 [Cadophora gregata]KAK0111046.1 hypothetical protein ONS95_001426 [Cadophora gregata]KAK0112491.1 hypothetical protein ONS96_001727 [Cadophora gregata f. sp. sojae]